MQSKKFQRKTEDFICENCHFANVGDGYTNHCHKCLYSKHVDINPGDREEKCHGLMRPIALENRSGVFYIIHKCAKCGKEKANKAQKGDDFNELVRLSLKRSEQ